MHNMLLPAMLHHAEPSQAALHRCLKTVCPLQHPPPSPLYIHWAWHRCGMEYPAGWFGPAVLAVETSSIPAKPRTDNHSSPRGMHHSGWAWSWWPALGNYLHRVFLHLGKRLFFRRGLKLPPQPCGKNILFQEPDLQCVWIIDPSISKGPSSCWLDSSSESVGSLAFLARHYPASARCLWFTRTCINLYFVHCWAVLKPKRASHTFVLRHCTLCLFSSQTHESARAALI